MYMLIKPDYFENVRTALINTNRISFHHSLTSNTHSADIAGLNALYNNEKKIFT
jgi:hypothetical protein